MYHFFMFVHVPTDEESSVDPPNPAREASEAVDHSTPTTAVEKENESHDGEDDSGRGVHCLCVTCSL